MRVISAIEVGDEGRITHQIAQVLTQVALDVEAQMIGHRLVAQDDALGAVEHQQAVGRGLEGRDQLLQPVLDLACLALEQLEAFLAALDQFGPVVRQVGRRGRVALAQPVTKTPEPVLVDHQPDHGPGAGATDQLQRFGIEGQRGGTAGCRQCQQLDQTPDHAEAAMPALASLSTAWALRR